MRTRRPREERSFQGIAVSPGVAIAPLEIIAQGTAAPLAYPIDDDMVNSEQQRFGKAIFETKKQLKELKEHIKSRSAEKEAEIFEAHLMVLDDSSLIDKVISAIKNRLQNAEYAFYAVMQNFLETMRRVPDPYLRERTADLEDVMTRVLKNFAARGQAEFGDARGSHIVLAHDLSPSDTATMARDSVHGFATELGSINSHSAILARSLGIPAIVGLDDVVIQLRTLAPAILDGYSGKLIIDPTEETLDHYRAIQAEKSRQRDELSTERDAQAITTDGHPITLSANIEFNHELPDAAEAGAEGVGLYRTEFFLLDSGNTYPDELQQFELYSAAVQASAPHQVIFRTLDAGGDKLPAEPLSEPEPNPFLGWRGIRVSLSRPQLFKTQLRALLRASAHGRMGIMFPLISSVDELEQALAALDECRAELTDEGHTIGDQIEIGVMIEVPSAVLLASHLAKRVDFFSIGTNDLIQYTVAVDRVNNRVANLYEPAHPAIFQLMQQTVSAGSEAGIWTGICGEMAGDLRLLPLLVGLGVNELSCGTHQLPFIRRAIRQLSYADCTAAVEKALKCAKADEVRKISQKIAQRSYGDLLT